MDLDLQHYCNRHSLGSKIGRVVWHVTWLLLFRITPRGNLFRPWRIALLKLFGAKVRWSSNVLPSCRIWQPWRLTMGDYACLSADVDCYTVAPIVLGDNATVSQGVKLCTASHDISSRIMELTYQPIVIGANAWVAGWSIVLPGVTIGEGAVVGAGAVVTKDVEPWTVVGGNPAKVIGEREIRGEEIGIRKEELGKRK